MKPETRGAFLFAQALMLVALAQTDAVSENIDPANDGSQYAYAENAGWINAEPSGDGGPGVHVANFTLTGWMWGENVGWISLSCANQPPCPTAGYRVRNDGHGRLSGFAWGENVGWISFSCEDTGGCATSDYGVAIDPVSGDFSGRAWGENVGWFTFASDGTHPFEVSTGWCQSTDAPPDGAVDLRLGKSGMNVLLTWTAVDGAEWYEIVGGGLNDLRGSGGDFSTATASCLSDNVQATSFLQAGVPAPGAGFWFLVRGTNCKGKGSYDTDQASQAAARDADVLSSGNDCE